MQEATSPLGSEYIFPTMLLAMADLSAELRICFSFLSLPLGEDAVLDENLQMSCCLMLLVVLLFFCFVTLLQCILSCGYIYIYMAVNDAR